MYRIAAAACTLTVGSQKVGDIRKKHSTYQTNAMYLKEGLDGV